MREGQKVRRKRNLASGEASGTVAASHMPSCGFESEQHTCRHRLTFHTSWNGKLRFRHVFI